MGRGSSKGRNGLGGGAGQKPVGNSILTQASLNDRANAYEKLMDSYQNRLSSNPNNIMYRDQQLNYSDLTKAARSMNPGAASYSGLDAVIAMDASPMGTTVNIQGITFSGTYTKKHMTTAFGTGDVWVDSANHAFGTKTGTLMSELNQIRGGRLRENKNVKVSF